MERQLFDLLARYGAPVLFLGQMLGILGPIPDELLLTIAGALVRRGDLRGPTVVVAAIAGSLTGITLSYTLGRFVGLAVLRRLPGVTSDIVDRAQSWFMRFGKWLLAFGCFVPGVRHVTAIAAGSAPLDFRTFAAYAYPGAVLWTTTFVAIGYYAGGQWQDVALLLRAHLAVVAITLGMVAAGYLFATRHARA